MYMQRQLNLRTIPTKKHPIPVAISHAEAHKLLKNELKSALTTTSKQLDDWMHMQKHKEGAEDGNGALFEFMTRRKELIRSKRQEITNR